MFSLIVVDLLRLHRDNHLCRVFPTLANARMAVVYREKRERSMSEFIQRSTESTQAPILACSCSNWSLTSALPMLLMERSGQVFWVFFNHLGPLTQWCSEIASAVEPLVSTSGLHRVGTWRKPTDVPMPSMKFFDFEMRSLWLETKIDSFREDFSHWRAISLSLATLISCISTCSVLNRHFAIRIPTRIASSSSLGIVFHLFWR